MATPKEQLYNSATHAAAKDKACPVCNPRVTEVRAMAFVDREKQTFSRYAELFPNYEWTDSATAIDLMAAEIKCLRSELLDACRLATSMREFAKPEYATTRTAEWENWKKLCARLTALLIEIRARWYGGVL